MFPRIKTISLLFIILIVSSACNSAKSDVFITGSGTIEATFSPQPTFTHVPTITTTPAIEAPSLQQHVCSPLEGEKISELAEITTQLFKMPRAGQDDGHHGVDFAFYRRKDLLSIDGIQVLSALDGEVVTIINDKYPYGNAVIIETPLDSLSPNFLDQINFPALQPTVIPDPKFSWVPEELPFLLSVTDRSLYIYYAHLKYPSILEVGDKVACGQQIGFVGNTGDSSNPHLHFETRVGPSGARFESMAYYTAQSTQSERYNYIVWRIRNLFQLFDPMKLLSVTEEKG
ncbi:MAG: M23 family metallopeptidase [Pelolinea sp.]|nr:M23 family metallopeptidase [Pelolinea sp.]